MKMSLASLLMLIPLCSFAQNNQLLVLSGGGSPASNHYSQFLQTKTVYEDLSSRLNYKVDLFFGAGNNLSTPAILADVHKIEKKDGLTFEKYIVGAIKNNSAATKSNVYNFFKTEVRPQLDSFFMVVSDHGMPNEVNGESDKTFSNNCIDLWNAKVENGVLEQIGPFETTRCLSKNELKNLLMEHVQAKKKIFAMSQCFSGGFHQMSVDETGLYPKADPNVCGFTAITHDSWASGCSPDVDGPTYQGYERSFTEQLTGYDYVNNKRLRQPRNSFLEAHNEAILEDLTVDIPLSTSEYYLWRWALKLSNPGFISRTSGDLASAQSIYEQAANFSFDLNSYEFKNKKALYLKMGQVVKTKFTDLSADVDLPISQLQLKVDQLKSALNQTEEKMSALDEESGKLFETYTFKLWLDQITNGSSVNLTSSELEVEKYILSLAKQFNTSGSRYLKNRLLPIMWVQDAIKSEAYSIYLSQRVSKVYQYALSAGDTEVIEKTNQMAQLDRQISALSDEAEGLAKRHGLLRRLLIYRQTLGAWAALSNLNDQAALSDLDGLLICEKTKL